MGAWLCPISAEDGYPLLCKDLEGIFIYFSRQEKSTLSCHGITGSCHLFLRDFSANLAIKKLQMNIRIFNVFIYSLWNQKYYFQLFIFFLVRIFWVLEGSDIHTHAHTNTHTQWACYHPLGRLRSHGNLALRGTYAVRELPNLSNKILNAGRPVSRGPFL